MNTENPPVRVVHFRNLSDDATQEDLMKVCKLYGRIEKTIILKQKHQAMVQFARLEDAKKFVEYYSGHPLYINRRQIYVGYSRHDELAPDKCNRILLVTFMNPNHRMMKQYFLNIFTADFVYQLFSQFGSIEKIIVMSKAAGIQSLVQFENINNAINAKSSFCGHTFTPAIQFGTFTIDIQYSNLPELNIPQASPRAKDYRNQPAMPVSMPQPFPQNSAIAAAFTAAAMAAMGNAAATNVGSNGGQGPRGGNVATGGFQYPLFNFPMFYPQGMMAAAAVAAAARGGGGGSAPQRGFEMPHMMQNGRHMNNNNNNGGVGNKRYYEDRSGGMRGRGKSLLPMVMAPNGGGRDWNNNGGGGWNGYNNRRKVGYNNNRGFNNGYNNNNINNNVNNGDDDYEMESGGVKHKRMRLDYDNDNNSNNSNGGDDKGTRKDGEGNGGDDNVDNYGYNDDDNNSGVVNEYNNGDGIDSNSNNRNDDDDDDDDRTVF